MLFCSYQPFYFNALDSSNEITLSLEASSKAHRLNRALKVKNSAATQVPLDKDDDEDKDDENASAPLLFYGFMTKQGTRWKRRGGVQTCLASLESSWRPVGTELVARRAGAQNVEVPVL